jgi:hypothetical protein
VERARTAVASTRTLPGVRSLVVVAVVVAAALTLLVRLPPTLSDLSTSAHKNNSYDPLGRTLAAADSLDIDNAFAVAAMQLVPQTATFTVVPPPKPTPQVAPLTIEALRGYFRYLLLPRHEILDGKADYVLCYSCASVPDGMRVRWIWHGDDGLRIGRSRG